MHNTDGRNTKTHILHTAHNSRSSAIHTHLLYPRNFQEISHHLPKSQLLRCLLLVVKPSNYGRSDRLGFSSLTNGQLSLVCPVLPPFRQRSCRSSIAGAWRRKRRARIPSISFARNAWPEISATRKDVACRGPIGCFPSPLPHRTTARYVIDQSAPFFVGSCESFILLVVFLPRENFLDCETRSM